jgi:trk system potassium uptake protein TrkA
MIRIACSSGAFDVAEFAEGQVQFLGYRIDQDSPLCDLTLMELGELRGIYRFVVVAIQRKDETIIPHGADSIQAGDRIYLFAHQKDLPAIQYMLQTSRQETPKEKRRPRRAFILGGGRIGLQIAQGMEGLQFEVKLIERDEARCQKLAEKLDKTVVLHTEGSDIQTLKDEGIEHADVFIAVTDNDETNILTCLLARQNGVQRTLALVSQPELLGLASDLGIDACIAPRLAAASAILKFVRRGEIISLATIEGSNSEVLEIEIKPGSGILDTPLRELHFPRGAIIGAIVRGQDYEIPTGASSLRAGDRVVIFALPGALSKVERFFE